MGSFIFKNIHMSRTTWQHLFLIGRKMSGFASWTSVTDFEEHIWLGYVSGMSQGEILYKPWRAQAGAAAMLWMLL